MSIIKLIVVNNSNSPFNENPLPAPNVCKKMIIVEVIIGLEERIGKKQ